MNPILTDVMPMQVGDRYQLSCGHEGRIVFISEDEKRFWVQGKRRGCATCGKGRSGEWTPTVYLIANE
jgi:hypothetical protein